MAILSGYKRWKKTVSDENSDHIAVAYWTVGEMVELENGSNVEDELKTKINIVKSSTLPTENIKSYPTLYAIPSENNPNLYTLNEYNSAEDIWCQYGGNGDKQDLSGYYNNADYNTENNKLQFMNGDTVLKEIEITSSGYTKIPPKATVDPTIINGNTKCKITDRKSVV